MSQVPTIGRIVMYMLSPQDCDATNRRRTDSHAIKVRIDSEKWPLGAQIKAAVAAFLDRIAGRL